jgi:hypothetical protein
MSRHAIVLFFAIAGLTGCKGRADHGFSAATATSGAETAVVSAAPRYTEPPTFDTGLSVEDAYAAIPHRRTVWIDESSTASADEKLYLKTVFRVLDQAVAARVAAQRNFTDRRFEGSDIDGQLEQLLSYLNGMPVPKNLVAYHKDIVTALTGERQFFADWKVQRGEFPFAQQIAGHPGVSKASSALHTAYSELISKFPNENQSNKDAFFDYHCAVDFL